MRNKTKPPEVSWSRVRLLRVVSCFDWLGENMMQQIVETEVTFFDVIVSFARQVLH